MPSYKLHFISLGCAKNVVNCEQMMSLCQEAGHTLLDAPEGADAVVVNTCGFITSASEEAIEIILQMGQLKKEGKLKRRLKIDPALRRGRSRRAARGGRHPGNRQLQGHRLRGGGCDGREPPQAL